MKDIVFLSAQRTPIGSFLGALGALPASRLGATAIRAALEKSGVPADAVDQVIMGNVLQAGQGQAPARQAAIYAGLPPKVGAVTVHKVCGSGMRAVMDAANGLRVGEWEIAVAGGMESMSNAPHLLLGSRKGLRMGDGKLVDSMVSDGLWDPYGDKHMGNCAETCVQKYKLTREQQDAFALESYRRAQAAVNAGHFTDEIAAVEIQEKKETRKLARDEEPFAAPLEKMPQLRPAFDSKGTVTAANASKLNDGAAALVLTSAERAKALGLQPLGRLVAQGSHAQEPEWFTTAPAFAAKQALQRAGLGVKDIARWEINEAFAAVAMAAVRDLELDPASVNVNGGAVALGHPIGASGARIITTLLHTLRREKLRYGCAAICIGGGEATAVVVENLAR